MAKNTMKESMENAAAEPAEEACDCECHRTSCEGGACMANNAGTEMMSGGHNCCGHRCMRNVWRAIIICLGVMAVFWIGICVGEFRAVWDLDRATGPGMMYNTGDAYRYQNMMYRGAPAEVVPESATLTREATSSEAIATSTPAKAPVAPKKK